MRTNRLLLIAIGLSAITLPAAPAVRAQSEGTTSEREAILFVQSLAMKNGQSGIELVWLPQPLKRFCLGKTAERCALIDYCTRTTNPGWGRCQNVHPLPSYPAGMVPRRMLSVVLMKLTPNTFANLQEFVRNAPAASLERLSLSARVKARVRFTRSSDDDSFQVLEITEVAPF